ncbi:trafficking kinesin-binding protein 1-like isoform X2 [Patiria miniata]|uniref:Trafficking kinesin-binding protein 1-like n=1 Tax=Patiria miniata TaxID=46514 RepID=A0A914B984_PATMI|nr:trafficking kinesin-binding protein 1-like isoform X2 [Patiria miniata]
MTEGQLCNGTPSSDSEGTMEGEDVVERSASWNRFFESVADMGELEAGGCDANANKTDGKEVMPCSENEDNKNALCGDRVVQMTKTYNDIDAVTRLLEEKEKDLELAAKIGQSLLEQNKQLEKRIDAIEEQFTLAADQNTQLKHDMKLKEQLLRIYTNEVSYSDSEDDTAQCHDRSHAVQSKFINVEALQKKVRILEEENFQLRMETAEMKTKTVSIEEKEAQLVQDAFKQLGEAQGREGVLTEELSRRLEETYQQKDEITCLLTQVVELQQKVKKLSIENEELQHQHHASREAQQSLTKELQESRDKADEYFTMLNEARSEAKEIHRRSLPKGNLQQYCMNPLPVFPADSLAAELIDTVEQELAGSNSKLSRRGNKREQNKSIMRSVKDLNRASNSRAPSEYSEDIYSSRRTSPGSSTMSLAGSTLSEAPLSEQYEGDNESNNSPSGSVHHLGRAGIPGSNDLETALRRLNLRKQNQDAEAKYAEEEKLRLLQESDQGTGGSRTPTCPSPGSIWSTESFAGLPPMSGHGFRSYMPEKLQIVKPMEGSLTLYHWQRLAQPHMASMLDSRPGIMVKGFRELERDMNSIYSMDDVEDDGRVIERTCVPSKCFVNSSSTYTYTTSTIGLLDNTLLTSSTQGPRMANTEYISKTPKPVAAKTFSTSLGLAQVLKERDVDQSTEPKVLTKVEAAAINPAGVNAGLNMFGASTHVPLKSASEAKREGASPLNLEEEPQRMHRISSRIFSRFAVPVRSKNITDALDPETKTRLMEKVRKIRAEKETSEHRARTLQRRPSIPSVRTRDVVMSPVRTPRSSAPGSSSSALSVESSCMGIEGAVSGYSPPGVFGSHTGTVHRSSGLSTDSKDSKVPRKLFLSDDSGIELGFGTTMPAPTVTVSNPPFQMTFTGTVSTTCSVPGFNTVLSGSIHSNSMSSLSSSAKSTSVYSNKGSQSNSSALRSQPGSHGAGLLGALGSTETVSSLLKQQGPRSTGQKSTVSSHPRSSGIHTYGQGVMSSGAQLSSAQQGCASLIPSGSTTSRPRSSVMPIYSKSTETSQSLVPGVGLASLLGASRPSVLPIGEQKKEGQSQNEGSAAQATAQRITSPISMLAGHLPSLNSARKPDPTL